MLCFSDADECIFVKTMSHIRQAEKTLSIERAFNYSDLIEARFTLGLDNITLKSDKTANEILNELF